MFLPHFDIFCDLLLNMPIATWIFFILYNKEPKQFYWRCHLCIWPPPTDPICHLCQGAATWFVLGKQGTILSCVQSWYFLAGLFFHFSNCSNCIVIGPHGICVSSTK